MRLAEDVDVGHRVAVGVEAEVDAAVVGGDADRERLSLGERRDGIGREHLGVAGVERGLRAGHVGDHDVVEPARHRRAEPGAEGVQRRRREAGEVGERRRADGLAALHLLAHRERDLVQPHRGPRLADGEVDDAGHHLVGIHPRRVVAVDADGHHGAHRRVRADGLAAAEQPRAEAAGDRREHDVVDRHVLGVGATGQALAHEAVVVEVGRDHDPPAGRADLGVERRVGGRARGRAGDRGEHLPADSAARSPTLRASLRPPARGRRPGSGAGPRRRRRPVTSSTDDGERLGSHGATTSSTPRP